MSKVFFCLKFENIKIYLNQILYKNVTFKLVILMSEHFVLYSGLKPLMELNIFILI